MKFSEALEILKSGGKVRRAHWMGFWVMQDGTIMLHCKDGSVFDIRQTDDVLYTLENIAAEDWEAVDAAEIHGITKTMRFGEAIRRAKLGAKISRLGWNGKNQYVELASNISYVNGSGDVVNVGHEDIGNRALAFVGTRGVQIGWLASQADMLAEDWILAGGDADGVQGD